MGVAHGLWLLQLSHLIAICSFVALCILPLASATSLSYKISAHELACFYAWVDKRDEKVAFYFAVQTGGSFDIDYVVKNPQGITILEGHKERQGDYVFTGKEVGEYSFCFSNGMSTFAEKLIDFDISVENEPRATLPPRLAGGVSGGSGPTSALPAHTMGLTDSLDRVSGMLSTISRSQKYFRTRENRNMSTVKSTEARLFWFSFMMGCATLSLSAAQVFIVQTFFSSHGKRGYV